MRRRAAFEKALILSLVLACRGAASLSGVEDPVRLARKSLDIADSEAAIRYLSRAIVDDPGARDVHALKGYAFYRLGQFDQASGELEKERKRFPKNEDGWTLAAAVLYEKGDLGGAEALALGYWAAFEKEIKGRLESKSISRIAKKAPNGGIPSFVLGLIGKTRGREAEAASRIQEALKLGYDADACRAQSTGLALRARDFAGALKRASETRDAALKEGPEMLTLEALALRGLGQREESLAMLAGAAEGAPFEDWAIRNYAVGLVESGRQGEAMATLSAMLKIYPADSQARELFDMSLSRKMPAPGSGVMKYEADFPKFDKPIYRYEFYQDPDDLAAQVNAGSIQLIQSGDTDLAAGFMMRFLELYPNAPTLEYNLAQLFNVRNAKLDCLRHAWKAIALKPDYRDAWDLAANALFRSGDYAGAVRLYGKAVLIDVRDPDARYNLGCAQFGAGDSAGAEASWREAIVLESPSGPPTGRGEAPVERKAGALDVHVRVRVNPVSVPAAMNLAKLYADTGRDEMAFESLGLALKLAPQTAEAYFELGKLRAKRAEREAAAECFRKYVELGGDSAKTLPYIRK